MAFYMRYSVCPRPLAVLPSDSDTTFLNRSGTLIIYSISAGGANLMNDESTMVRRDTEPSCRTRSLKLTQLNGVHSVFF